MAMARAQVTFEKVLQHTQDYDSSDPTHTHMVSKAFFTLKAAGKTYPGMYVELRQPAGTSFETEVLEVGPPVGPDGPYEGPWNHDRMADLAEHYYRGFVGSSGSGVRTVGNVRNLQMRNSEYFRRWEAALDIP